MALDEVTQSFKISDLKNLIEEKRGIPARDQFLFNNSEKTRARALPDESQLHEFSENPVLELYFQRGTSRINLPINLVDPDKTEGRLVPPRLPFDNLSIVDEFTGTIYRDGDVPLIKMMTSDSERNYTTTANVFRVFIICFVCSY